jgi:myo-inositol 2-dehydrogenase/D-chiro-inositol 1-dehydrogenase
LQGGAHSFSKLYLHRSSADDTLGQGIARHRFAPGGGQPAQQSGATPSSDGNVMAEIFRLGLVGAGRMGRTHMRALSDSELVRVIAVAEPSEASRAGIDADVEIYPDVLALLGAGNLDGVLLAAPSTLHLRMVTQLAAAGMPILCEKPCGVSVSDAREAATIAERHGTKLQIAYWRRFVPSLRRLRQRIIAGELGALYFIACYQWDGEPPPIAFRASSGGIFVDMGVHEFDQIRWLSGQEFVRLYPVVASASSGPLIAGDADSAQILCSLSGGSTALVSLGRRFPRGDMCRVEAFGTRDAEDCRFLWPANGEAVFLQALRHQAEAFARWVRGGEAVGATAGDAIAALDAAETASVVLHR